MRKSSNTIFFITMLVFLVVLHLSTCDRSNVKDSNIVAIVENNHIITYNDLRRFVYENQYNRRYEMELIAYTQALNLMITNHMKYIDFLNKGLDSDSALMQNVQRYLSEEIIVKYFNTQFLGKYTNEEYIRQTYENMKREVMYRQIVLYKPEGATSKQLDSLMNLALTIKLDIENGSDFEEMVDRYSQHEESLNGGGYMPSIDWEKCLINPVYKTIFDLNSGEIRVLEAYNAFYVVKITEINTVDVKPYEDVKNKIKTKLRKGYYETSLKEYDNAKNKLLDKNEIKWNHRAINKLVELSKIPNFFRNIYQDTLTHILSAGINFTILTYPRGEVDFKKFFYLLNNILIPKENSNMNQDNMKEFIIDAVQTDLIVNKAKELGLDKELLGSDHISPILKNEIVKLYDLAVIESEVPDPEQKNLMQFYNLQKDSLYYHLEKINLFVMPFAKNQDAEDAMQKIKNGTPFENISGRWLVKTYIKERDGTIKSFRSTEKPQFGEKAFNMVENEVAGPLEYTDPEEGLQYAVIKVKHSRPERQLQYNDVKNTIAEDFNNYYRNKIKQKVEKLLWEKYDVQIYEDVLKERLSPNN